MDSVSFDDEPSAPQQPSAADFFSSGSPSARFNTIGDTHSGTIVSFEEAQQRDIKTSEPKFWPDGKPAMMLIITIATNERDEEIEDDDGQRRLYVNKPSGMFAALRTAIGKEKFQVGGKLAVRYTGDGKAKQAGFNKPKEYSAKYVPPGTVEAAPVANAALVNGHWTWIVATGKAAEVGITEAMLKDRLKARGLAGYNATRDTAAVKDIIALANREASPFSEKQEFKEEDIPF